MELKDFTDYNFADIPADIVSGITELEENISAKMDKDVILIAYQQKDENSL